MDEAKIIIKEAIECHKRGDFKKAEEYYLLFISLCPKEAKAYHLLGSMFMQEKNFQKAQKYLTLACNLEENSLPMETDLSLCCFELGDYENAFCHLENILKSTENKLLYEKIIECAKKLNNTGAYLEYSLKLLNFSGDDLFKLREIAGLAQDLGKFDIAKDCLERVLKICPDDFIARNNLGLVYEYTSDFEAAEACYKRAIKIKPTPEAAYNLAVLLRRERKYDEAEKALEFLKTIGKNQDKYDHAYGLLKLIQKDFSGYMPYVDYIKKESVDIKIRWDGKPNPGASLVICTTEGYGDVIMFSRYLDFIDPAGFKEVTVITPEALYDLIKYNFPGFNVVKMGSSNILYTSASILMELPLLFNLDFEHIPSAQKYLLAPPEYSEKWKIRFNKEFYNIGLFFSGNTSQKRTLFNRKIDFNDLETLFNIESQIRKVKFYSLQPESTFKSTFEGKNITDLSDEINNFSDTAAIIENLDLVVTVDSSVLHLAGALGKKTFLMLPYSGDWRWFEDDKTTPWYDSVTIFRQQKEGEWQKVISDVKSEIEKLLLTPAI